jgi:hypothetical protein
MTGIRALNCALLEPRARIGRPRLLAARPGLKQLAGLQGGLLEAHPQSRRERLAAGTTELVRRDRMTLAGEARGALLLAGRQSRRDDGRSVVDEPDRAVL